MRDARSPSSPRLSRVDTFGSRQPLAPLRARRKKERARRLSRGEGPRGHGERGAIKVALVLALAVGFPPSVSTQVLPGDRLPEGRERPVREREIDILHYSADLRFDMEKGGVSGTADLKFTPLRFGLRGLDLDAADLDVVAVEMGGSALIFDNDGRRLRIRLPAALDPGAEAGVRVSYSCHPRTGLYFFPAEGGRAAQAWNYGDVSLHYGWLPLYADVNDRFAVELRVTVPRPLVAVSKGVLRETLENADGTRTFHWVQEEPIPQHLMTVDVGDFVRIDLGRARVEGKEVPLAAWVAPGREMDARATFGETPRMLEFFSRLFGRPFPWARYDQVALREFSIEAMETVTAPGFAESSLRGPGAPPDSEPSLDEAYPTWTIQDTIAHELAHHWFGDLVTCRSLGSVWLNESFATFAHTLWHGVSRGEDDLTYQRWRYLDRYLAWVRAEGTVRPLEYLRYDDTDDMYQMETTYVKGALVLHMIRHILGDRDFFRSLAEYLGRHAFGSVDSADLRRALEESIGRSLGRLFDDWITGGAAVPPSP